MWLLTLLAVPALLAGQAPKRGLKAAIARANAAADSSQFAFEFGSDLVTAQSGDSLPAQVRAGFVVSPAATLEVTVSAKVDSGYTEYDASLGPTLAIFPGATAMHGQYVHGAVVYHNDGNAHQFGVRFGSGNREVAVNGLSARMQAYVERLFKNGQTPPDTRAGVMLGLSLWR
jgi:hypothetical protein